MEMQTAAPAPVTEEALPETVATEVETDDYSAAFDRITAGKPIEEEPVEGQAEPELKPEPEPIQAEAPTDLPVELRKHWQNLPEDARDAVLTSQREMSRKLSDMGRQVQGIAPIRDVLVSAVKDLPALGNMKPEQVASEVVALAKISADFRTRPLETFLSLAKQHNMTDALRQALGGNADAGQQIASFQSEIRALQEKLDRASNPEFIREQVSAITSQERAMADIQTFADGHEHWGEVENFIPSVIPFVKQAMPEAPPKDILAKAYDIALQTYRPELKAKAPVAVEATIPPDPERTQAALKAKSINVASRPSGQQRELSEDERYAAAYDRASRK
jgi:TolA-binding protein